MHLKHYINEMLIFVTGPAKTNHVSTNYIKLSVFLQLRIFSSECCIPSPSISEESTLNSVILIDIYCVNTNSLYVMIEQRQKIAIFCADFCRPGHIYHLRTYVLISIYTCTHRHRQTHTHTHNNISTNPVMIKSDDINSLLHLPHLPPLNGHGYSI